MTTADRFNEQVRFTRELAAECFPDAPLYFLKWSKRMTSCAGSITWHSTWTEIKLSNKIFFKAAEELGVDEACEKIHETLLHELGHLIIGKSGHGYRWQEVVQEMGGSPSQYHSLSAGRELIPAELRQRFPVGSAVSFEHKGVTYHGVVDRHNPKNVKIICDATEGHWKVPWSIAADTLKAWS